MNIIYNIFGTKGSGKDTTGSLIKKQYNSAGVAIKHYSFASYLKDIIFTIFGSSLSSDNVYGDITHKEAPIDLLISDRLKEAFPILAPYDNWSGRLLLQFLGTEICREINHNCWAELVINKILTGTVSPIIITDCRFPNEYAALNTEFSTQIEKAGYKVVNIRVDRKLVNTDPHESEMHSTKFDADYIVENSGPLEELEDSIIDLLSRIKTGYANS